MTSPDITRTSPFWLIFAISAVGAIVNAATTPVIPLYVEGTLGGSSSLAGLVIAASALASMISMPFSGYAADRIGYRRISIAGGILATIGLIVPALAPELWLLALGRILFGLGSAAALTLTMTWLVALTPTAQRGRALSIFGLSVWIGVAAGPLLGTWLHAGAGAVGVFWATTLLTGAATTLFALIPAPAVGAQTGSITRPGARPPLWRAFAAVWVPGIAAAAAWCGEGLLLGFAIVHLEARGVAATGLLGAANIFAVFAGSVILARIALSRMPDRIGPLRSTAVSLVCLSAGLVVLAVAPGFLVAALGAALMGIGFSPLYPSLTMLATRGLSSSNRALGLGIFSSFTSIGYASGAIVGGLVLAVADSMWAFVLVGALQLAALLVVVLFTRDDTPRTPVPLPPRDPAA